MNAIGYGTLAILLTLVLGGSRRWAMVGLLGGVLYMTLGQWLNVAGLNLYPMRVLMLAAMMRTLIRKEWTPSSMNELDWAMLVTFGYRTAVFLLHGNGAPTIGIGVATDVLLSYFAARGLLTSLKDLTWMLKALAILLLPYVALLYVESKTGVNPFTLIGGIADHAWRGDRPRCLGGFGHASLMGTFAAGFLPLYFALSFSPVTRGWGLLGGSLCLAIVYFANSGGPITGAMLAVAGWGLWLVRRRMALVRSGILIALIGVGATMNAPLWYLPAKMSFLTGGDGWHRSYLMDVAFRDFARWSMAGMPELETKAWFPYHVASGGADLINYYLDFGIAAGVVCSMMFIYVLYLAFRLLGRGMNAARARGRAFRAEEMMLWALGVMLVAHVFNWFGMVYFDQNINVFYTLFAAISTLGTAATRVSATTSSRQAAALRKPCIDPPGETALPSLRRKAKLTSSWPTDGRRLATNAGSLGNKGDEAPVGRRVPMKGKAQEAGWKTRSTQ